MPKSSMQYSDDELKLNFEKVYREIQYLL